MSKLRHPSMRPLYPTIHDKFPSFGNVHLALAISGRRSIIEFSPLDSGGLFGNLLYG